MSEAERAWIREILQRHFERSGQQLKVDEPVPFESQGFDFYCPLFRTVARGTTSTVPLVVKILPREGVLVYISSRLQYRNEGLFYGDFLRFLLDTFVDGRSATDKAEVQSIGSLFPKLFCAHEDDNQCLLALEDLGPLGFVHAPKILDIAHMELMLRELGKIHALSYVAKKKNPEKFFEFVKQFNRWDEEKCRDYSVLIQGMAWYAVEQFRTKYPDDGVKYADRLARLDAVVDTFAKYLEPEEPLAVLCHGDYNRNNVLFKYDADGRPSSVKVIDLQFATYSSPAVDLALLLFLSTSPEVRDAHWDELFDTYRTSLLDTMQLSLGCRRDVLEVEYSKELMARDFGKFCPHAFLITVFYLPAAMMGCEDSATLMRERERSGVVTTEEVELRKRLCSDEVKHRLAVLVKVMLDRHFL